MRDNIRYRYISPVRLLCSFGYDPKAQFLGVYFIHVHVQVNAAMSVDGKLSTRERRQVKISGSDDFARVTHLRKECDAIAVGVGTVMADNPHLVLDDEEARDARRADGKPASPHRIVLDSTGRTPTDASILDSEAKTFIVVSKRAKSDSKQALRKAGAEIIDTHTERVSIETLLTELDNSGVEHLVVEGGGEIIFSFFDIGAVDSLTVYVGSIIIGGRDAPTLADGDGFRFPEDTLTLENVATIDDGVLLEYSC